jgi:Tol biopolymer transport system component
LGNSDDLLLISHNPNWQPGMKSGDSDGCLVDLRTGRYRRIPFQGIVTLPGCFLKDRRRVIVSGLGHAAAILELYEIDLKTGENRLLGGDALAGGNSLMPVLSPDGKTIAVIHKKPQGRPLDSQIYLIDVNGREANRGVAKPLGEPADVAFLSWPPDGQGLLMLKRESADPAKLTPPLTDTIARLGMDGRTTRLLEGSMPVVLNDGKTVLFRDSKDAGWQTCDLAGKNVRPFANGLADHLFPSPGPDGKRIVWMHFVQGAAPVPTLIPIGATSGQPIVPAAGLWSLPCWR